MNSRSGRSQQIKHNYTKIYALTAALCLVVGLIVGLTVAHFVRLDETPAHTEGPGSPTSLPSETGPLPTETRTEAGTSPSTTEPPIGAISWVSKSSADIKTANPLLPVSAELPFTGMPSGVVNIYAKRETRNDRKLQLANSQISVNEEALRAFEELNFALIESYPEFELLILAGMPTDGTTGSLSCSDGNKEFPASDHAAGYALDARYTTKVDDKTVSYQFSDPIVALQTAFLFEKGAKLGIIQSRVHVEERTSSDLRHLRYVGIPHASYIYQNNLTLESYLNEVKGYNINRRLQIALADGTLYEVYYVASSGDTTSVPLPTKNVQNNTYTIYGNGTDGFIGTLKK